MSSKGTAVLVTMVGILTAVVYALLPPSSRLRPVAAFESFVFGESGESASPLQGALSTSGAAAQGRSQKPAQGRAPVQYHFDTWTTDNGLPQNCVNHILQTRDDFIWLTTNDGLVRYDGVQFTVFNAGNRKDLKHSRFWMLFEDRLGNLWTLTEDNHLLRYFDGTFTAYTTDDGLPSNRVLRIKEDEGAPLCVETASGVAWWKDGKFVTDASLSSGPFAGFGHPARPGVVWHLDASGFHRVENGRVTAAMPMPMPAMTNADVKSIFESPDGTVWMGITNGILARYKGGKFTYYGKPEGLPGDRINCILEDRRGNLWVGLADSGLYLLQGERLTRYTKTDGLAANQLLSLYEDREGIFWIGTTGGLNRLRDNIITAYSTENGLAGNNTYPICQDRDGAIWIGAWSGISRYQNGVFSNYSKPYDLTTALITSLMTDRGNALWVGLFGGGVVRYKDGEARRYTTKDGLPHNVVRVIYQDRQGVIWFGTSEGLARYADGAVSAYTTKDGLPSNAVFAITQDRQGDLWLGTQMGLCHYHDGVFTAYPQEASLSGHMVRAVYEDGDGVVWIGTYDAGLTRFKDGRFTNYSIKNGLFNNGVFQILEDGRENFWISCNLGIYRVSKRELTDYAEGRAASITSIPYGKRDGMLSSECNGGGQPAGIKAADGKLWFPTQGGVVVVDPEAVPTIVRPPQVMIEEFLLDNRGVAFAEAVEIPPTIENFEIHYTGLSFVMPERIRFKYKLEGLDTDWIDAGTRRVAYYSHVPPGNYTFRVIAANRDGVWNLEGAGVPLRVIPPFWRTPWFLSLVLASVVGLAFAAYRWRINQLEKERRAQEAFSQQLINSQESERQRIAAELHDGLGQHLLIIKNSALLGLNGPLQPGRTKEQLGDISETASRAIDEVREISYNLRPYQLDDLGLTKAIESIIAHVAGSSRIDFAAHLDSIDELFSPEAEINIYRVVQESLNNIVKHSGASRAAITIERRDREVEILIHDNGRGFNPEKTATNGRQGFGLKGISERARMLGARYVVHSAVGQGTTMTLSLEGRHERPNGRRNGQRQK